MKSLVIRRFLTLSIITISNINNRVVNYFVKLKVCQLQFFISLSNLNTVTNTLYAVCHDYCDIATSYSCKVIFNMCICITVYRGV